MTLEEKRLQILYELERAKNRILGEMSGVDKETLRKLRDIVGDYYNAKQNLETFSRSMTETASVKTASYRAELEQINSKFLHDLEVALDGYIKATGTYVDVKSMLDRADVLSTEIRLNAEHVEILANTVRELVGTGVDSINALEERVFGKIGEWHKEENRYDGGLPLGIQFKGLKPTKYIFTHNTEDKLTYEEVDLTGVMPGFSWVNTFGSSSKRGDISFFLSANVEADGSISVSAIVYENDGVDPMETYNVPLYCAEFVKPYLFDELNNLEARITQAEKDIVTWDEEVEAHTFRMFNIITGQYYDEENAEEVFEYETTYGFLLDSITEDGLYNIRFYGSEIYSNSVILEFSANNGGSDIGDEPQYLEGCCRTVYVKLHCVQGYENEEDYWMNNYKTFVIAQLFDAENDNALVTTETEVYDSCCYQRVG